MIGGETTSVARVERRRAWVRVAGLGVLCWDRWVGSGGDGFHCSSAVAEGESMWFLSSDGFILLTLPP
jgi:hypothetical protein